MPYTSRLAVVDPVTPTLTITIYGQSYPAIPVSSIDPDDAANPKPPQFGAGQTAIQSKAWTNYYPPRGNYPAMFAAGYSTGNTFNDYIGSKVYTMSAFDSHFNDGAVTSGMPLILPEAINVSLSGTPTLFDLSLIIPSVGSTADNPECLIFVAPINNSINPHYWSGLKKDSNGVTTVVKLWETGGTRTATSGRVVYAACTDSTQYYVLWNNNVNYPYIGGHTDSYAFTICEERTYPDASFTNYAPGFNDPNLPASLDGFDWFSPNDSATFGDYTPIAMHGCDLGFIITYKKKVSNGNWTHHYILVSKDWTTFQWVEFVAGNALAQAVIDQSNVQPFNAFNSTLNMSTLVTAYHKGSTWYVLGGDLTAPIVCTSDPVDENYGLVSWGTTNLGEEDYWTQSSSNGGTAVIDGMFFGFTHESFPYSIGGPNDCTIITILSQGQAVDVPNGYYRLRPWTCTLDGHDWVFWRVGDDDVTLVYDTQAEDWYVWGSQATTAWKAVSGQNWQGGTVLANTYGSNIPAGDDTNGALYFLNAENAYDDDYLVGNASPHTFTRKISGQVVWARYGKLGCHSVELIGSVGDVDNAALTDIQLETSDNQGHTYNDRGTKTIVSASYTARVNWRSLGSFDVPGRLFRFTDTGAFHRIDSVSMLTDGEAPESN